MFGGENLKPTKGDAAGSESANTPAIEASTGGEDRGSVVLVVGGDESFSLELARIIDQGTRRTLFARGGVQAERLVREHHVVLIVLSAVIDDMNAQDLFTRLREYPWAASVPVLFLGERLSDSIKKHRCRTEADGDMEGSPSADEVAAWVRSRLRRVREVVRDARRDSLTGLPNRAAFCEEYPRVAKICGDGLEPMTLALVAIDACGSGGSTDGGKTSDEITPLLSSTLSTCLRATDTLARWSQDEFVALLPGEHYAGGVRAMEKVLAAWHKRNVPPKVGEVTISAGLAVVESDVPLDQAVMLAGRHLQSARAAGGNRVVASKTRLSWQRGRILLVVHNKVVSKVFLNLLKCENLRAVLVGDADEAVKACSGRWRFQLIVIDEQIPGKDGLEALAMLKSLPRNQSVPFMMLLKEHSEAQIARVLQMGANDFAVRPFDLLQFVSRVRSLLAKALANPSDTSTTCRVMVVDDDTSLLILAGSALNRYGGVEVCLSLGAEDAISRLQEEPMDVAVVPLPMLEARTNNLMGILETLSTDSDLIIVATVKEVPSDPGVLRQLGCCGALKRPLNPLTLGEELFRLTGIRPNDKAAVPDSRLSAEIQRVIQHSSPGLSPKLR